MISFSLRAKTWRLAKEGAAKVNFLPPNGKVGTTSVVLQISS
jgi:hypothetical protein